MISRKENCLVWQYHKPVQLRSGLSLDSHRFPSTDRKPDLLSFSLISFTSKLSVDCLLVLLLPLRCRSLSRFEARRFVLPLGRGSPQCSSEKICKTRRAMECINTSQTTLSNLLLHCLALSYNARPNTAHSLLTLLTSSVIVLLDP